MRLHISIISGLVTLWCTQALEAEDLARYVDPGTGISVMYPSHWMLEGKVEDGEIFTVNVDHTAHGGRCLIFAEQESAFEGMNDEEAVDFLLASDWYETRYREWFPSFETVARARSEISGHAAVEIQYITDLADVGLGTVVESIDYIVAFDGQLLTFGCFSGIENFADLRTVFVDTLQSVTLPTD